MNRHSSKVGDVKSHERHPANSDLTSAIERTVRRYATAPRGDRIYVRMKLKHDPAVAQIASLGHLGAVLDAGCGRGQLGLLLIELGRVDSLKGVDIDQRKIGLARQASNPALPRGSGGTDSEDAASNTPIQFESGDVAQISWDAEQPDSVLLVDVLHYMPPGAQDALVEQLAGRLSPGGRLIIREAEPHRGLRGRLTRWFESLATRTGYNRAPSGLAFRSITELRQQLGALGLDVTQSPSDQGTPVANVLLVARKPRPIL